MDWFLYIHHTISVYYDPQLRGWNVYLRILDLEYDHICIWILDSNDSSSGPEETLDGTIRNHPFIYRVEKVERSFYLGLEWRNYNPPSVDPCTVKSVKLEFLYRPVKTLVYLEYFFYSHSDHLLYESLLCRVIQSLAFSIYYTWELVVERSVLRTRRPTTVRPIESVPP